MAINNKPIFTGTPVINWCINSVTGSTTTDLTAAHTLSGSNGATANVVGFLVFTSDATNGGYVQKIRFRSLGTNSSASVGRIWINNGGPLNTASNNTLFDEISLPATTVSQTSALPNYELPLNFALPAGYKVFVTLGTTVQAGYDISVVGGSYVAQP